jgi:hypothetical protein
VGRGPVKRHPYLSANSLKLREEDIYGFSRRSVQLAAAGVIAFVLLTTIVGALAGRSSSPFTRASIDEGTFSFSAQYYKDATVQHSRGTNYLVNKDADGKETTLWVAKLKASLSCGSNPAFDYQPTTNMKVHQSCYTKGGLIYASDIEVDGQVYQINMTSQKPIRTADAKAIFGSISIEQ